MIDEILHTTRTEPPITLNTRDEEDRIAVVIIDGKDIDDLIEKETSVHGDRNQMSPEPESTTVEISETKCMKRLIEAYLGHDLNDSATHEAVGNVKRLCEKFGYPLRVKRPCYYERGERNKNASLRRGCSTCVRSRKEDDPCQFVMKLRGYLRQKAESGKTVKSEGTMNKFTLRVHLWPSPHFHNYDVENCTLCRELGKAAVGYAAELNNGRFKNFTKLVGHIERKLNVRIDGKSLCRQLRYAKDCSVPRSRDAMMLIKHLREIRLNEPGVS